MNEMATSSSKNGMYSRLKPFLCMIFLQFGMAGSSIIGKFALNQGMNHYTFAVYRNVVATVVFAPFAFFHERQIRPKMTMAIFIKIAILALLEPVIDQNLYYLGLKYTTATFSAAMCNILPALTFIMAWILRIEEVSIRKMHSQAKIVGTTVTLGGAMIMSMVKGPALHLWTKSTTSDQVATSTTQQHPVAGAIMITAGCFCWASFVILQSITLKSYPAPLSLTALICLTGAMEGAAVAAVAEWGNLAIWSIHLDSKFLAAVYSGVVCSGIAYYIQGVVMKERGPVFVTAFSPLAMVIVAIIGFFVLAEELFSGRILGAVVIVVGLYLVVWGKSKDQLPAMSNDHPNRVDCHPDAISNNANNPENCHKSCVAY